MSATKIICILIAIAIGISCFSVFLFLNTPTPVQRRADKAVTQEKVVDPEKLSEVQKQKNDSEESVKRLSIKLPPQWHDRSADNPKGPSTFVRDSSVSGGALQISIQAEYKSGNVPNPTAEQLIAFAEGIATKSGNTQIRGKKSGSCVLGQYGTVLVKEPKYSWIQVWVISNGRDFVLATHTCVDEPSEAEVNEASWIVKNLKFRGSDN